MPIPVLFLERRRSLGRDPVASDFTLDERRALREGLERCIRATDGSGDDRQSESLRGVWRRCVALGEPPRFDIVPDLAERRQAAELAVDLHGQLDQLGAVHVHLFPEDPATD